MIPNLASSIILSFLVTGYSFFCGLPLSKILSKKAQMQLAAPIGVALLSIVCLTVNSLFGVGTIQSLIIFIIPFIISVLFLSKDIDVSFKVKLEFIPIFLAILLCCIVISGLFLKKDGPALVSSDPIFDHIKVALINSINRNGLPPMNPFMMTSSNGYLISYYYLWYLVAASIARLFSVSGWSADISMTFATAFISIMTVFGLIKEASLKVESWKAMIICIIILFSGGIYGVSRELSNDSIFNFISREHGVETWLVQASWVPQHLCSACFDVIACFYISKFNNKLTFGQYFLFSVLIGAGIGMSVWVGSISFVMSAALIFIFNLIKEKGMYYATIKKWSLIALGAAILALPVIKSELAGAIVKEGAAPIGIHVYKAAAHGGFLRNAIYYVFVFFPLCVPALSIGLIFIVFDKSFRKRSSDDFLIIIFLICIGSFFTSMMLRSQIANNDLGWRSIIPFLLAASALVSVYISEMEGTLRKFIIILAAGLGLVDSFNFSKMLLLGNRPFVPDYNIGVYEDIVKHTGMNDRILVNTHEYDGRQVLDGNIMPALLMNRSQCFQNMSYAFAFGNAWGDELEKMDEAIDRFYKAKAGINDIDTISKMKCDKIVVTKYDTIWSKFPYSNFGWKEIYKTPDYAIYAKEISGVK